MPDCWNCGSLQPDHHRFCAACGQDLAPSPEDRQRLAGAVDYLLRETGRWSWLSAAQRDSIQAEYSRRRARLGTPGLEKAGPPATAPLPRPPAATPAPPAPPPPPAAPPQDAPVPPVTRRPLAEPDLSWDEVARPETPRAGEASEAPRPGARRLDPEALRSLPPAPASAPEGRPGLSGFLEEANIRWVLVLGGLLLASSGVGLLYSQWSAHGRLFVALGMLLAPALCFGASWKLRATLPLSSRILALVGGLLLPTGLVAARAFELGGLRVPWPAWNLFAFSSSALVLLALAALLEEIGCLYLGTLALTAASGALASWAGHPPAFGLGSLGIAAAWLAASRSHHPTLARFRSHFFGLSQGLAALGLLSTFPSFLDLRHGAPTGDLSLLLLGAAFFAGAGFLTGSGNRVLVSAPAAMACLLLLGLTGEVPALETGYGLVALAALYTAVGWSTRDREGLEGPAQASFFAGTVLVGLPLAVLLAVPLVRGLLDNFAGVPPDQLRTAMLVALAASALYTVSAAVCGAPGLMYGATASLAYAWFLGSVMLHRSVPGLYGFDMSVLPLAWVVLAWLLRRVLPRTLLTPLVESAILLACLPAPANLVMRSFGAGGAETAAPATLLVTALTLVLATPWLESGKLLYLAAGWGSAAWSLGLPRLLEALGLPAEPVHHGLAFLPLLVALSATALALQSRAGEAYAVPVARVTLAVASLLVALQLDPGGEDRTLAALTLGLYALGFAALALPFREWRFLDRPAPDLLAHLSVASLAAMLWVVGGDGADRSHEALLAFSALGLLAAPRLGLLPGPAREALWHVSLPVTVLVTLAGPPTARESTLLQAAFANGPALLVLAWAWMGTKPTAAVAGSTLLALGGAASLALHDLPALGSNPPGLVAVAALALGFGLRGYREEPAGSMLSAWLFAGATWHGLLDRLAVTGEARVHLWILFWLLLVGAVAERRARGRAASQFLEAAAGLSAVLLLGRAALESAPAFLQADLVVAAVLLAAGWWRTEAAYFLLGWGLLAFAPLQAEYGVYPEAHPGRAGLQLALLAALAAALGPAARERAALASLLGVLARLTALGAALLSLQESRASFEALGLAATAGALWLLAWLEKSRVDWHLGFVPAWLACMVGFDRADLKAVEIWLAPLSLWLLAWGEIYRKEGNRDRSELLAVAGVMAVLVPALLATATGGEAGHLVFLVAASVALLLAGLGRRHRVYAGTGSLFLLSEIVLQALRLARMVPWWYVALASGLLLVGLGVLFERRRMHILKAGQDLIQRVSGW